MTRRAAKEKLMNALEHLMSRYHNSRATLRPMIRLNSSWFFLLAAMISMISNGAASTLPAPRTTPIFVRGHTPCPAGYDDHCQNNSPCIFKLELGKWKGPHCRCSSMFYGLRCELFRPPVIEMNFGMLTEAQTLLIAGGVFIALVLITLIICIVVGVRWYRQRVAESQDNNVEQPLMNGAANGADSSNNNNNNEDNLVPLKVKVQTTIPSNLTEVNSSSQLAFNRPVSRFVDDSSSNNSNAS